MPAKDTIVSFWDGLPNKGQYLGCGVCIAPDTVLTAYHVLAPKNAENKHIEVPQQQLRVGRVPIGDAGLPVKAVHHHEKRDISLVILNDQHNKLNAELAIDAELAIQCKVDVLGIDNSASGNHSLKVFSTALSSKSVELNAEGWKFHSEPSHGMSGGGVFVVGSKRLVGITQARTPSQNAGIMIPLTAIWDDFLNTHLPSACTTVPAVADAEWQRLDRQFMAAVELGIEKHLNRSPILLEKLGGKFGQLDAKALTTILIAQCESGEFVGLVQKTQAAFKDAWGALSRPGNMERSDLLDAADELISHLVLFNIKSDWLAMNYGKQQQSQSYTLPKLKLESANAALSRLLGAVPSYKKYAGSKGSAGVAKGMGTAIQLESGAKPELAVPLVLKMLAAALMPDRSNFSSDVDDLAEEINGTLAYYRNHSEPNMRRRHFILLPKEKLLDPNVRLELSRLLPELAWVTVDMGDSQEVFIIKDLNLKTAIEQFFITLEGVNQA